MRLLALALLAFLASPAWADPATDKPLPVAEQPKPDLEKPITITLAKLQRIVSAATAQAQAQCVAQGAQADVADLMKQATPEAKP